MRLSVEGVVVEGGEGVEGGGAVGVCCGWCDERVR